MNDADLYLRLLYRLGFGHKIEPADQDLCEELYVRWREVSGKTAVDLLYRDLIEEKTL
jgi:hypothetical protein